ncbi:MAG: sigma factor [Anaerolineales bacterium]
MDEQEWLAERFEVKRAYLQAVAYRMLGSLGKADDAVQEAWLRLSRSDTSGIENLGGWLTTVVARVCLDMLRSRKSRREQPLETLTPEPAIGRQNGGINPESEALLADSVGLALLVVLERLTPAERSRLCCTTCSLCPSPRSLPSPDVTRLQPGNLPAVPAARCGDSRGP